MIITLEYVSVDSIIPFSTITILGVTIQTYYESWADFVSTACYNALFFPLSVSYTRRAEWIRRV